MNLTRNIFSNAGATAIGSALQLALVLLLARWLDVHGFAVYVTATAIIGFGEMASDFGVRIWGTRQFAIRPAPDGIMGPALLSKALFSVLLILIVVALPIQLLDVTQALLAALIACTQPSTDPLLWYMRGKERLDVEAAIVLAWRVLNVLGLGVLAWLGHDINVLLVAWLLANILRILIEWRIPNISALNKAAWFSGEGYRTEVIPVIRQSFPIGAAFLLMSVYQRLGVLMLGVIASHEAVSNYGAAFMLVSSAVFVATSITVSSFPSLVRAVESQEWDRAADICERKFRLIMWTFLPACVVGMFLAPSVIHWLYPATYAPAVLVMVALMPGLYISSQNFALKYCMNASHMNLADIVAVLIGAIVFASIVMLAEGERMIVAAALAWGVGELAIFVIRSFVLIKGGRLVSSRIYKHVGIFALLLLVSFSI